MNKTHSTLRRMCATTLAIALAFPGTAFAQTRVDDTDLIEGANAVGGGTATYGGGSLTMENVVADNVWTDESLTMDFNGGNDIDKVQVTGDAEVTTNFSGNNEVEDIEAYNNAKLTVNMNDHNEFEDIEGYDNANVTVNVTGKTECESIKGYDNATVTVQGTTCPKKDVIEVGEDESSEGIRTKDGDLAVKDVTVVMHSTNAQVASAGGDVDITCTKIESGDGNERVDVRAGDDLFVGGSVIDIKGSVSAGDDLTIRRSNVDVKKAEGDESPYRVWAEGDVELIEEENGEVREGTIDGKKVSYVDTDDGDDVHLTSALTPCYYKCDGNSNGHFLAKRLPTTGEADHMGAQAAALSLGTLILYAGFKMRKARA